MHPLSGRCLLYLLPVFFSLTAVAEWKFEEKGDGGHRRLILSNDSSAVVELVYGDEELKPFLHVYGRQGERLTEWSPDQQFSHHRGIFIGWNRIQSDLGRYDLWHLNNGGKMRVTRFIDKGTTGSGRAFFEAEVEWHAARKDESGSSLLLREIRRFEISSEKPGSATIDAAFQLTAARDLRLDGDLQHSGIHFRGSKELLERQKETTYLWEPPLPGNGGRIVSDQLKWCRLFFPIGDDWYSATQLNAPSNPVEELSWRDYGRFGFFFRKSLAKNETLKLNYRFITSPENAARGDAESLRDETEALYRTYVKSLE